MLNKKSWKRYELETKRFSTYDDARKYIKDKADKYRRFCIDDDSYVEDYGNAVFVNFLGIRIDFSIFKADHMLYW
jgi:hypothetical protein